MMHRWLTAAALMGALLATAGCVTEERHYAAPPPPPTPVSASPVIDRILQHGELRVGTSGTQPPLTATTKSGTIIGFDVDLAAALAKAMNVKLTLVPIQFSDLMSKLESGDVDMVLSGLTMTPQRNLHVAFVGPYLVSGMSILTKEKTLARMRRAEEINTPKVTLAALRGSTAEKFAQDTVPKAKIVLVNALDDGVAMVRKGKVDALLADHPFCVVTVYRYRNDHFATLETPFTFEPLGIALPPNDPLLMNWAQNALADLDDSGVLLDTMYKWFEADEWVDQLR
jgi:polar amino acid transport system substrate-binding protein